MKRRPPAVTFLFEAPLALLSFLLFRGFRWLMRRLAHLHYRRRRQEALTWRPLSAATLRNPLALPVLMTSAPRWNTHAVIATAGPLPVRQTLAVDVAEAGRSATSWAVVVYTFPGFKTVASLDSLNTPADATVQTLTLKPGRYWLGLRYYHWSSEARLPAVLLDGTPGVASQPVPSDVNAFYESLRGRRGLFYFCLHYYVWVLLRHRERLPRRMVEREYLPVGNPGTYFYYGALERGESVRLELGPALLAAYDVYLTVYNRASFPEAWCQVRETHFATAASARPGHYLLRVQPRAAGLGPLHPTGVVDAPPARSA